MRALLVAESCHSPSRGGVDEHVKELALKLESRGLEVYVAHRKGSPPRWLRSLRVPLDPGSLREAIRRVSPDVVHAHYSLNWYPLIAIAACRRLQVPCITTIHSLLPGYERPPMRQVYSLTPHRPLLSRARALISVSRAIDSFVEALVGRGVRRIIIPNAVDTDRFRPPPRRPDGHTVLYVGRLVYRKGVHVLLQAFREVAREVAEARLVIAGSGYLEPALRALALSLGLRGRVEFKGAVDDEVKASLYRESQVVVVPSLYGEGFGIVAIESMASGTPVVASSVGGLREVVRHEVDGLLVRPGSVRALAEAIRSVLTDRALRERLSRSARARVESEYSWSSIAPRIVEAYAEARSEGP